MGTIMKRLVAIKSLVAGALFCVLGAGAALAMPTNSDFESGVLAPWYQDTGFGSATNWEITTDALSGTYSAFNIGNARLRQDFAGIQADDILSITFDLLTDGHTFNAYNFFYSDNTGDQYFFSGIDGIVQNVNVTANLEGGKTLVGFGIYGNTGGSTTLDNFNIAVRQTSDIPAPAAIILLGGGLLGLGMVRRRRR